MKHLDLSKDSSDELLVIQEGNYALTFSLLNLVTHLMPGNIAVLKLFVVSKVWIKKKRGGSFPRECVHATTEEQLISSTGNCN